MSQEKKYSAITEQDINNGLKNGTFKEDGTLIRHKNGEIVKVRKDTKNNQKFPSTLFQFNTMNINHTIIYQTDIQPYIDELMKNKHQELISNLNKSYNKVIDSLKYYKSYNERLNDLNLQSQDTLSDFEDFFKNKEEEINNNDIIVFTLYINILFINMITTYKLHGKKILFDAIIKEKIKDLEQLIQHFYEELLAKTSPFNNDDFPMNNSLYAEFYLNDKKGISKIKKYIKYDSRISSFEQFISDINDKFIKLEDYYDDYNNYYRRYVINLDTNINSNSISIVEELFNILEKIDNFKNIYSELIQFPDIDLEEINSYITNESFEILAIN